MTRPVRMQVEGMHCASCSTRLERVISNVDGVRDVVVNLSTETASFEAEPHSVDTVAQAIEGAGFSVVETEQQISVVERREKDARQWAQRIALSTVCAIPVMGVHWASVQPSLGLPLSAAFSFIALVFAGRPFFQSAWSALKGGGANMDSLVVLGSSVAFVYSLIETVRFFVWDIVPLAVFFDATVMILALISVGKFLEARAKKQAASIFESLNLSVVGTVDVWQEEAWVEVDVRRIVPGDRIRIATGGTVPVDGVLEGPCSLDESLLTGESIPVHKDAGDEVHSGSLVVNGVAEFETTAVGRETTVSKIQSSVEQLQDQKADVQKNIADRVSAIFVPSIIVLSVLTFALWLVFGASVAEAVAPAIAVLVVACPCALGLATPVAIMVGSARAAQRGVLVRDVSAFERARKLRAIAFDKTGTLTERMLEVDPVRSDEEAIRIAAAIEEGTSHPIGDAIIACATAKGMDVPSASDFATVAGIGVSANVEGTRYDVRASEATEGNDGATRVGVFTDENQIGEIVLTAKIRPEAGEVITALKNRGVDVWMISGDSKGAANAVAASLGIDHSFVAAQVTPDQKAALIAKIETRPVAMVGDGINDGPALAAAEIGVAMGGGSDFAKGASSITIIGDSLWLVVDAIDLAQATFRTILQNLAWAFGYNLVLVPIAALGYLTPVMASAAMALSSVSVVLNSLRIKIPPRA